MSDTATDRSSASGMLLLQVRGEGSIPIAGSGELGRLLDLLLHDPNALAALEARCGDLRPLLPAGNESGEPDWLAAAEMLEEGPACPGERLLAHSLAVAAEWWRADAIAAAARALEAAIAAGAPVPASIAPGAVCRGCAAVAAAVALLPAARQARLRHAAELR